VAVVDEAARPAAERVSLALELADLAGELGVRQLAEGAGGPLAHRVLSTT